jgi:hypothetical protein
VYQSQVVFRRISSDFPHTIINTSVHCERKAMIGFMIRMIFANKPDGEARENIFKLAMPADRQPSKGLMLDCQAGKPTAKKK